MPRSVHAQSRALLLGALLAVPASAATLTVDGSRTYQTIDGFGTNINSLSWNDLNSKAAIDLLADQMGQTLWRVVFDMMDWEDPNDNADPAVANQVYYDALYSNRKFQNLWGTLRYLNQKGFDSTIALSFMGPLAQWMGGATVDAAHEDEVVEAIVTLVAYARNTAQVRFGMLDPFNESDWNGNEGPKLSAAQYVRLLEKILTRLDALGVTDLQVLGPNTADVGTGVGTYLPAMMASPKVMARLAHFAFHSYSASTGGADAVLKASAHPGKNFWMTEYAVPEHAFALLQQNASGLLVWEGFDSIYNHAIARGEPAVPGNDDVGSVPLQYNATTPVSYTPRKEFYLDAQLFRFVPPGSQRVEVSGASGGLVPLAFVHPPSGRVTLVVLNTGATTSATATLKNLPAVTSFATVKTDATNDLAAGPDVPVTQSTISFSAPGGGIVTLTAVIGNAQDAGTRTDAGIDAGVRDGGTATGDGGSPAVETGVSGSCACRATGGGTVSMPMVLLVLALPLLRRRVRRTSSTAAHDSIAGRVRASPDLG